MEERMHQTGGEKKKKGKCNPPNTSILLNTDSNPKEAFITEQQ